MKKFKSLLSILFLSLVACADTPEAAVGPLTTKTGAIESETIIAEAVKYIGRDSRGRKCNFYVSITNDHDGHDHRIEDHLLIKMDYSTADGHRPLDSEASIYFYNTSSGSYSKSANNSSVPALVSMIADHEHNNPNDIDSLIDEGELEQYVRVELSSEVNTKSFINTLEAVIEGEKTLNSTLNILDTVDVISLGLAHGDHYHFPSCFNFQADSVEVIEFELDAAHDHDHGHGHDH